MKEIIETLKKEIVEGLEPSRKWRAWNFAVQKLQLPKENLEFFKTGKRYAFEIEETYDTELVKRRHGYVLERTDETKIERWSSEDGDIYEKIYKWELVERVLDHDEDWGMWKDYTPDMAKTYTTYEWVYKGDKSYKIDKDKLEELKKEKGLKFYYLPEEAPKAPSVLPHIKAFSGIRKMPEFELNDLTIQFTDKLTIKFHFSYQNLSFVYDVEMKDADEWEGADWEDLPEDYRIEIDHTQSLGREIAEMLNHYKYPENIEEIVRKAKQEAEFEKQVDEEVIELAREAVLDDIQELVKERNQQIKEIVMGQKLGHDIKVARRIVAKKGDVITEDNIDNVFRFILVNPKMFLPVEVAEKVNKIIKLAKEREEKLVKEEVKALQRER